MAVLKGDPTVVLADPRLLLHCCNVTELAADVPVAFVNRPKVKPFWMKATVCDGLLTGRNCGGFGEMVSTIGVGVALAPATPRAFAFPRTLVIRITRLPLVPGGSIGTPRKVTELEVV